MGRVTGIEGWLEQLGLAKYAARFAEHEITPEVLPYLTEADIDRLALPTGPRRRVILALEALAPSTPAPRSARPDAAHAEPPREHNSAERRQVTVMFCDLADSTELSAQLDPEDLRTLTSGFRSAAEEVIARYEGRVAQYRGDAVMAYFGWPVAHEDDAERSVRAALEVVQAVKRIRAEPALAVRIGVATGTVVVGGLSPADDDETKLAVGETPNLAARLQALAGADEVVIAPGTRRLVGAAFELSDMGLHSLRGIAEPVRAWRVHAVRNRVGRFEAARAGAALTPLVGRQEELALLLRCWSQTRGGEGQVVLVGGEPGIGKSRLIVALRERIGAEPCTVLRYQCSPYHLNSALHPIIEHLAWAARFEREDTADQKLDKLEQMLGPGAAAAPLFAALLSLPAVRYPALGLSPQKQKEKTFEALGAQLDGLSRRQPVLMVLEDAHWIDPTTQEAVDALVPLLRELRIMLVVTHRPEYAPHFPGQRHVTLLNVGRLGRRQEAELVTRVAGGALPEQLLERIAAHTDGVPLFVEELTKSVLDSGVLHRQDGRYTLRQPLPALAVPTSLRDSLLARLDRLAREKHIIQIAACIGREFSYDLLARVCTLDDEQLRGALRKLTDAGLLFQRGKPRAAAYAFKHALVQDAAYESLLKSKRQQLHGRIAQVLGDEFADRSAAAPEVVAQHHTQARNLALAVEWWRRSGELALRGMTLREAIAHFDQALALIEQLPPSTQRDELELSVREPLNGAWIAWRGWSASEVTGNATAILRLASRRAAPESLLMGLYGLWISTLTQGRVADALPWADRLIAEGDKTGDIDLQVLGHTAAMVSHFYLGRLLAARKHGERVVALYDPQRADRWMQLTGHDTKSVYLGWSAHWTWMLGYPDRAVRISDEKDAHARTLGHALDLGYALTVGAYPFDYRREPARLAERVGEADRLARQQDLPILYSVMVPQVEGLARLRGGELAQAARLLREGIENWNGLGGHTRVPYLKSALAEALALQGNLDAALQIVDQALEQIERPGWQERSHLAEVLRLKGWMLMKRGQDDTAQALLRASIAWAREQQARSWELRSATTLAELLRERGQRAAARELLAPVYGWFTEGFDTHDLHAARTLLETL
jgi:class 3 adenylate cyclase/tetratricopeptide (TPR) repeat protein